MLFLLFALQGKSEELDYKGEGWNTLESNKSPTKMTLTKGLALMMVSWPDASLTIDIPNFLKKPVKLTPKDKYSLFTFSDNVSIEIEFSTTVTYFIFKCPQFNSIGGAIQFCSNVKQIQYSIENSYKDLYYSVFGSYTMKGSISLSLFGSATLHYWVNNSAESTTTVLNPLNLPTIKYTSALIRSKIMDSISYESLTIRRLLDAIPTVPTTVALEWDSVSANQNNFLQNMAYGGSETDSNLISNLLSNIPTDDSYSLNVIINELLLSVSTIEIDIGDGKETVSRGSTISRSTSYTANFYITYDKCKSKLFKTVIVNEIGVKTINLTISDIPKECSNSNYVAQIYIYSSNSFTYGLQVDNEMFSEAAASGGIIIKSKSANHPFILSFYVKNKFCTKMTKVKEISITKAGTTDVSLYESDFPDECKYEKKQYYVNIKNGLSSKVEQSVLIIKDKDGNEKNINQGETFSDSLMDLHPFKIQVLIQTKYCEKQSIQIITATETTRQIIIDDSLIPNQCLPYMICLSADVDSNYSIGYKNLDSTDIIPLTDEINVQKKDPFDIKLYLIKSPSCQNNYELANYSAQKKIECKKITVNDIPSECLPVYYETCFDISKLPSEFKIYYKINNSKEMSPLTNSPIQKLDPFTVTLFLSESPGCFDVELKTYNAEIKPKCIVLTESNIPSECKDSYRYVSIKNSLTSSEYKIYAYDFINYTEIYQNSIYNKAYQGSFEVNVFMKSPSCKDYKFVKTAHGSKNKSRITEIADQDIPYDCKKKYMVCVNLESIPNKYQIKYSKSFETSGYLYYAIYGENKIIYHDPFTLKIYLTKSPGCDETILLTEIEAYNDFQCINITDNIIPENCKIEDISPNENTKSESLSLPIIAGISGVVLIIITIVVVVIITIVRKKKNKVNDSTSQTLGNSLLTENYGSIDNF